MIICIGREFGSGGHEIGKQIAEELGYEFYDRELVEKAAEKMSSMPVEELDKADEKKRNPWLYRAWYEEENEEMNGASANDILFHVNSQLITELTEKGNCVFVGRCADYILEKNGIEHLSFFIAAPFQDRVERKMKQLSMDEKTATALVRKKDKERKAYYNYYTGGSWGKPYNYDFCVNSSKLGIEETAKQLAKRLSLG